jgi:hypothetical protein
VPSRRGGRAKYKYVFHRDPRDPCFVFFQDPRTHDWHTLRWTGLPEEGRVPAFSDARVRDVLREVRRQGLTPKSDAELLPLLLDLIGANIPVEQWPTRLTKTQRVEHAREVAQAAAAAADRPADATDLSDAPGEQANHVGKEDNVVPLKWRDRAGQGQAAIDGERRRRREAAVSERPSPPPRLGDRLRAGSLLALPDDDEATTQRENST